MNQSPAGAAKFGVLSDFTASVRVSSGAKSTTKIVRTAAPGFATDAGVSGVDAITYSGSYPVSKLVHVQFQVSSRLSYHSLVYGRPSRIVT